MGRVESVLPRKEQSRAENYTTGDRVRAVIKAVNKSAKGPQVMLSRTDPALLIKLFEQEVPEIYDGTVIIRGAVREAGDRAKVAVYSRERDVDPVGACVGMKGTRVQAIIRELRGEKIDIVEWSEDSVQFVTNAISPAKVQRVSIVNEAERVMEVIVEDKQLSLAIGKKGRTSDSRPSSRAGKSTSRARRQKRREVEAQFAGLEAAGGFALPGIEPSIIATLLHAGYDSPAKVADAEIADLAVLPGMDQDKAELTIAAARLTAVTGVSTEESEQEAPAQEPMPSADEVAFEAAETPVEASADEGGVEAAETPVEALADEGAVGRSGNDDRSGSQRDDRSGSQRVEEGKRWQLSGLQKVAELLATSSQEIMALLKQRAGIEVKSASSTESRRSSRGSSSSGSRASAASTCHRRRRCSTSNGAGEGQEAWRQAGRAGAADGPALPPPRLVKTVKPAPPAGGRAVASSGSRRRGRTGTDAKRGARGAAAGAGTGSGGTA